ncbi:MAG: hypothetical protein ACTSX6_07670 [Candidatus Heimdallarchaeaceae archaeon]
MTNFKSSFDYLDSATKTEEIEKRREKINQIKGLIKVHKEVDIDQAAEILDMPISSSQSLVYEIIESGEIDLTISNEKIIFLSDIKMDSVLKKLDEKFEQ